MSIAPAAHTVTVVIVSYNVRALLLECIASLRDTDVEVIVVDNASTDDTVSALREAAPEVQLICNTENVGFARANNQALAESSAPYAVLLNPDTKVHRGAIEALVRVMENDPKIGLAGPRLLNLNGSLQSAGLNFPTAWTIVRDHLLGCFAPRLGRARALPSAPEPVTDCGWVLGACLMVRRKTLNEVGQLDEGYFMYGEEKDLCYRAKAAGWRVVCVESATVTHYGGQSARQAPVTSYEAYLDSQFRFLRKFYPRSHANLFGATVYLSCRARQAAGCVLAALSPRRRGEWQQRSQVQAAGAKCCTDHLRGRRG